MIALKETAYPRFNDTISYKDLHEYHSVTPEELRFARSLTPNLRTQSCLLVLLKCAQRLGRAYETAEAPRAVVEQVAKTAGFSFVPAVEHLKHYDASALRRKHWPKILAFMDVRAVDSTTREWMKTLAEKHAHAKHYPRDIVDLLCDYLIADRRVLPEFSVLSAIAEDAHRTVTNQYLQAITNSLSREACKMIDNLLVISRPEMTSGWARLKTEPKSPTPKHVRAHLAHIRIVEQFANQLPAFDVPVPKLAHFRDWARACDAAELREMPASTRYALAAVFVKSQFSTAMDDVAEILVKQVQNIENTARRNLMTHNVEHLERGEALIRQLQTVLEAFQLDASATKRIAAIESVLIADAPVLIERCIEHLAIESKNYRPFMLAPFDNLRPMLFSALEILGLKSASGDNVTERLITTLLANRNARKARAAATDLGIDVAKDLAWLDIHWRKLVIEPGASTLDPPTIHRKYLELALFQQIKDEVKNADLFVPQGEKYDDFREQLASETELDSELPEFERVSGLVADGKQQIETLKQLLLTTASEVDARFPENDFAEIVDGVLVLTKLKKKPLAEAIQKLDAAISERMVPTSIVDILVETVKWLGIDKHFKPLSGRQPKMSDHLRRVVVTVFCYGCNLGASQTSRSIRDFSRKQVSWLNLKSVTEATLAAAIDDVVKGYNRFELPKYWGSGKSASADGKQWRMWEENLISEYHIRYGSFGGIGYYHVADTYIALQSRFITCGSYEGHHILDGLMEKPADERPTKLHGDTQSQNVVVFALAYLLGIELMPRIRGMKDKRLFKVLRKQRFDHIGPLFDADPIDWALIERHWRELVRIAVSVKLGKITASTILRRFGSGNHKNKVYFAMAELGKVIRTRYLLRFIDDADMRRIVNAATNKSEEFNQFISWVFFGNQGIVAQDVRHEQQKLIKYNHLVANLVVFHNVQQMTNVLADLREEGVEIDQQMLAGLAPYRTLHINRFGEYALDINREVPSIDFERRILPLADSAKALSGEQLPEEKAADPHESDE